MAARKAVLRFALRSLVVAVILFAPAGLAQSQDDLDKVLAKMDEASQKFRTAQANFTWKMWNSVINAFVPPDDTGTIFFQKKGASIQMGAVFTQPARKQVVFSGDKLHVLQPSGQIDIYDASAHRDELETFLVLGFGSSGQEMRKSFDIRDLGSEDVGNVKAEKLELTPKSATVKMHVPRILLWIDPDRGVSVQQQLDMDKEGGDYRLAEYSDIKLNQNVPGNAFKLKASGTAKTVTH